MSESVIWLMDSDFCQNCGDELADVDGLCWWCWKQRVTSGEDRFDEDEYWDGDDEVSYIGEYDQEIVVMPKQTVVYLEEEELL